MSNFEQSTIEMLLIAKQNNVPKEIRCLLIGACIDVTLQTPDSILKKYKSTDLLDLIDNRAVEEYFPKDYFRTDQRLTPEQVEKNPIFRYLKLESQEFRDYLKRHNILITGANVKLRPKKYTYHVDEWNSSPFIDIHLIGISNDMSYSSAENEIREWRHDCYNSFSSYGKKQLFSSKYFVYYDWSSIYVVLEDKEPGIQFSYSMTTEPHNRYDYLISF